MLFVADLLKTYAAEGRLEWIGLRPGPGLPMQAVDEAEARPGSGLLGDRFRGGPDSTRQVTLLAAEHLAAIAGFLGRPAVGPELLRRNLVVSGLNPYALKGRQFRIGSVVLEHSGECAPCRKMETWLGPGGFQAVRGHGGLTARVLEGGTLRTGDCVFVL